MSHQTHRKTIGRSFTTRRSRHLSAAEQNNLTAKRIKRKKLSKKSRKQNRK